VLASWGLIVRANDALPFALEMARSGNPEVRADATSVFERLRDDTAAVGALVRTVESERELEPLDSATDGDTRFTAAQALGAIVGKRFRSGHEIDDALIWLDRQEN
jgi:HEAT repeat protein